MTVLLTGAGSFLGKWTAEELQKRGHCVFAFRHGLEPEQLPEDIGAVKDAPVLIHFGWAGKGSAGRQDETVQAYNLEQSMETLMLAQELQCRRFIFAGSQAEYSMASAYGRAKRKFGETAAEQLHRKAEAGSAVPEFLHLRIFSVYGPGDHENSLISSLIRARKEGRDMELGNCSQKWNYLYAGDFAVILAELAERKETTEGIVDVGGTDTRRLREFVEEAWVAAGEVFAQNSGNLKFGFRGDNAEGAADLCPDLSRLRNLAEVPETSFREGICRTCRGFC